MYFITPAISGIFGLIFLITWVVLAFAALFNLFLTPWLNVISRVVWLVIIIVIPVLGALIYLFWKKVRKVDN